MIKQKQKFMVEYISKSLTSRVGNKILETFSKLINILIRNKVLATLKLTYIFEPNI